MYKNCFLLAFTLCCCTLLPAQSKPQPLKLRGPVWFTPANNTRIYGVGLGAVHFWDDAKPSTINGIGIELGIGILLPVGIGIGPSEAEKDDVLKADTTEIIHHMNGLSISASGAVGHGNMNGISINGIGTAAGHMRGAQFAMVMCVDWTLSGLSVSMANDAYEVRGAQVSIIGNSSARHFGLQIGGMNRAKRMRGLQIGIGNKSKDLRGLQIGLWNINQKRRLPLINWAAIHAGDKGAV